MGWLETLRVILAILLALTLNQPEWREEYEPEHPPTVAVLWDNSRSMETQDVLQPDGTNLSRANTVEKLIQSEKWTSIANAEVVLEAFASSEEKNRQATDLNAALQTSLDRHPNLRAAVLISDGDWNEGLAPVRGQVNFAHEKSQFTPWPLAVPVFCQIFQYPALMRQPLQSLVNLSVYPMCLKAHYLVSTRLR